MADSDPSPSNHQTLIDRLSNLPEHILLHILSFLPTKMAAKTSVLSKPWQHLWTLVPVIDLYDDGLHDYSSIKKKPFEHLVSKVLDGNKAPIIRRLHIRGQHISTSSLAKWVSSATQRNVEELDLSFDYVYDEVHASNPSTFTFCCAPESCKTLVVMKLMVHSIQDLHFVIGGHLAFPILKTLHLNMAGFESRDPSLSGFFPSRFPLLEKLVVDGTQIHRDLNISLPILRRLEILYCYTSPLRKCTIHIEAPNLRYLVLNGVEGGVLFHVENLPNLVSAKVDVSGNNTDEKDDEYGEALINFVNALSDVRMLRLSLKTMKELGKASSNSFFQADRIQPFHNLVELNLQLNGSVLGIVMIMLSKFKNLEHLKITEYGHDNTTEYDLAPPISVPNCLTYHLTTFCFRCFRGSKYGTELAIYILKNSLVLENAKIVFGLCLSWKKACHSQTILSTISKGSLECQLEFDQEVIEFEHKKHEYHDYS